MEIFGVGPGELLLILVVALVVLGPERLPEVARQMGQWAAELRRLTSQIAVELQQSLELDTTPQEPPRADTGSPTNRRYCGQCGSPGVPEAHYCSACGVRLDPGGSERNSAV